MARFKNLQELILTASARWGGKVAFRHIVDGRVREIRYAELASLSYRCAQALWKRGLRPGDYLGICAPNSPDWAIACLAALRLGAIVVPLDARSRVTEILPIIDKVQPKLVVFGEKQFVYASELMPARKSRGQKSKGTAIEYLSSLFSRTELPDLPHLGSPGREDTAAVVFTSGTTGAARGVVLSHGNILANVVAAARSFDVDADDRLLSVLPLSHMFEFTAGFLAPLHRGAAIVYCRLKGPAHLKEVLKIEKISVLVGTPMIFEALNSEIQSRVEQLPRSQQLRISACRRLVAGAPWLGRLLFRQLHEELGGNIKFWFAGGAPMSPDTVTTLRSLGIPLLCGYGLTEASPIVTANRCDDNKPDSVGPALPGLEVKIDAGAAGEPGEILVSGPSIMQGYWQNAEATDRVLSDGWLRTGDSGFIDEDGHLHVTGRLKSMIVTAGGYNVYPEEIEEVLSGSSLIRESCVFGKKTARGEEVCAVIVAHDAIAHDVDRDEQVRREVTRLLADLADYKRLSSYAVTDRALPRTPSGKVRRGEVVQLFDLLTSKAGGKLLEKGFDWDDEGKAVCETIAEVMDPQILKGVCPSGSRLFGPEMTLAGELGLDSFARLELASRLEHKLGVDLPESALQDAQTVDDAVALVKHQRTMMSEQHRVAGAAGESAEMGAVEQPGEYDWRPWPVAYYCPDIWPFHDDPLVAGARRALGATTFALLKIYNDFQTVGADRLKLDPPYIVAANHTSHFDTLALLGSFPNSLLEIVHPVAAADYFFSDRPRSALSTYALNAIPFDRLGYSQNSMKSCERILRKGEILIVFPEGTRAPDGLLGSFKPGIAKLSITVGCPVIPAYISGAHDILPKGACFPRPEKLKVIFGVPLYPPLSEPTVAACQEFARRIREAVASLAQAEQPVVLPTSGG